MILFNSNQVNTNHLMSNHINSNHFRPIHVITDQLNSIRFLESKGIKYKIEVV